MTLYALVAALLALIGGAAALWLRSGKAARDAVAAESAVKDTARREAGNAAAADAAGNLRDGKTPDDVVRQNDGKWQ